MDNGEIYIKLYSSLLPYATDEILNGCDILWNFV